MRFLRRVSILSFFTVFRVAFAIAEDGSSAGLRRNHLGDLNHGATPCSGLVRRELLGEGLGDLRTFATRSSPVFFKAAIPPNMGPPGEMEYETEIHFVSERDTGFQSVVLGLNRRALSNDEQEAGAFSFVVGGERTTVYFSSRSSDRILARHHRQAMTRFLAKIDRRVAELRAAGVPFDGLTIERFHTHPTYVNFPHSGADILQDAQFDAWLSQSPSLSGIRFRSYVVMMHYDGEVYVEFEPRRHRLF